MSNTQEPLLPMLESALVRLENALKQLPDEFMRDASILRFEFTFDLFCRTLGAYVDAAGVRGYSKKDGLRSAVRLGLLADESIWFRMLEDSELVSQTYNERTALSIYTHLPEYLAGIRQALVALKEKR